MTLKLWENVLKCIFCQSVSSTTSGPFIRLKLNYCILMGYWKQSVALTGRCLCPAAFWTRSCFLSHLLAGQPDSDGDQHHTRVLLKFSQLHVQAALQSAARLQQGPVNELLIRNTKALSEKLWTSSQEFWKTRVKLWDYGVFLPGPASMDRSSSQ